MAARGPCLPFVYDIDIVGSCNLRCPSCPVGNSAPLLAATPRRNSGMMELAQFEAILDKIGVDQGGRPDIVITLFNWGEPTLHAQVGDFVRAINQRGYFSMVSTNLNYDRNLEQLVEARPSRLRVSLSGMTRATYETTHARGDIIVFKRNCYQLCHLMEKHGVTFPVEMHFHLYRHNIFEDVSEAAALCEELGFQFNPGEAFLMPLEKSFDALEGRALTPQDQDLMELLLVSPAERAAIARKYPARDCILRSNQMAINADGSVALCCSTYDPRSDVASSYLEVEFAELQRRRYAHPVCVKCMQHGLALTGYDSPENLEIKRLAGRRIRELGGRIRFHD
jgi:MoaA/NifB/PqqE/SkfB family radical SAM enzyme